MPIVKIKSGKLPLLIILPALIALGIGAFFLLPDDPPPQPIPPSPNLPDDDPRPAPQPDDDPLKPDPNARPRPKPTPGAPDSVEVAEAMEHEIWDALAAIRSRLELKFKYAEYQLDRTLTLEAVMRKLDRLDGANFLGTDYALTFPEGNEPTAEITCTTQKGTKLPDGPLTMLVNLRTGETEKSGRIVARDHTGRVLIGAQAYMGMNNYLSAACIKHADRQLRMTDGRLAGFDDLFGRWGREPFEEGDFVAQPIAGSKLKCEFACRTFFGEELAEPGVITVDYETRTVSVSTVSSPEWMPLPKDRTELKEDIEWSMRAVTRQAVSQLANSPETTAVELSQISSMGWILQNLGAMPFDLRFEISEDSPKKVTLIFATSFGRPLPFKPLRYVSQVGNDNGAFED